MAQGDMAQGDMAQGATTQVSESPAVLSDPFLTAILTKRFEAVVREMTHTLYNSARSAIINNARDFSCCLTTGDGELLEVGESVPIHTYCSHLQAQTIYNHHDDVAEGDAFLHNDPYDGNSHAADQTVLVPVFIQGEHVFTACVKAHQADIGNSIPTTYNAWATDVYNEGAVIFPCVRLQRDYVMIDDIVRIGMKRIRVPEVWHGDLLAALGAARVGERRLKELGEKYGVETLRKVIGEWFDYSELMMRQQIATLEPRTLRGWTKHDPIEGLLPDGVELSCEVTIDPEAGEVTVDLRDNPDNVPAGINMCEANSRSAAAQAVFTSIGTDAVPRNTGSLRCLNVLLREGCVVGIPKFPYSTSMATTNISCRTINMIMHAFTELGEGYGAAEGGLGSNLSTVVVSGNDPRYGDDAFINQLFILGNGGPGRTDSDGWLTWCTPGVSGMMWYDSWEIDEYKYPVIFEKLAAQPDTAAAGRFRGAPQMEFVIRSRCDGLSTVVASDGRVNGPKGALGGEGGRTGGTFHLDADGTLRRAENFFRGTLDSGGRMRGLSTGGGGFGDALEREPTRVLNDVLEGYVSRDAAQALYGVVFDGQLHDETLAVSEDETLQLRENLRATSI
jgi:N-methylhydantoinase B